MGSNIKTSPTEVGSYSYIREKEYIEENLNYFIEKDKNVSRRVSASGWYINEDHEAELRYLLLDYILEHFNLYELFVIFFRQDCWELSPGIIDESRKGAIEYINNDGSFTPDEAQRLKRKVWDMHPILYGLIHEFIHQSDLFWDEKKEEVVLPDFN
jgi:hypothetical protein